VKATASGHYSILGLVEGNVIAVGDRKITDDEAKKIFGELAEELLGDVFSLHIECKCSANEVDGQYVNECKCFAYKDVASTGAPRSKEVEV